MSRAPASPASWSAWKPPFNGIVATAAADDVKALQAFQHVVVAIALEMVIVARPRDVFDAQQGIRALVERVLRATDK